MPERFTRRVRTIESNGSLTPIVRPTPGMRLHNLQIGVTYSGGTNTVAACMTALTDITLKAGSRVITSITGTRLRDWFLLRGTTFDFSGLPNTKTIITMPICPEWFIAPVADSLAWNPARLGGDITVELTSTASITVDAIETVDSIMNAPSSGIITLETILPAAGSTAFYVNPPVIDPRGRLLSAHIYPDTTNSREITPFSLYLGKNNEVAYDQVTSAENDEQLERYGLTPAASGRTANIYDYVAVKDDMTNRAHNLEAWGSAKMKIEAGDVMGGNVPIVLSRLEYVPAQ